MATTENAFRGTSRTSKVVFLSIAACMVGATAAFGIAALLKVTKTGLPAMAAVDEVHLALPRSSDLKNVENSREWSERIVVTDWSKPDQHATVRGNVIGTDGESSYESSPAAIVKTDYSPAPSRVALKGHEVAGADMASDSNIRWFNARPARPARTIWMTVTGYSPDSRSCGDSDDGLTATMHSVTTNAMKMVAADTTVLPYGSMVSIPGYDTESIVPVLDCGSAIKGDKLDLLFPTHEEALKWGRQRVLVTVWEYADGKPMDNPRKLR